MKTSFNQVDLTNCDKEPIHQLGKIQQYGGLIGVNEHWEIVYCSDNIAQFCGLDIQKCLGAELSLIVPPAIITLLKETIMNIADVQSERLFGEYLFGQNDLYDISVSLNGSNILIEFEYHQALLHKNSLTHIRSSLNELSQSHSMNDFFAKATESVANLTHFDRVMLYRFHNDGSGEVIAENKKDHMDSFLGLRYPASDIPKQARKLYVKNLTRLIESTQSDNVNITSIYGENNNVLDLSMSTLRAVSPVHIEYLKNMGVGASFSLSIVVDGELWGLFACHHNSAKYLSLELRSIIEVYGEVFSLELSSRLRNASLVNTEKAQNLHVKIMASMNIEGTVYDNLSPYLSNFHALIPSATTMLWIDKKLAQTGMKISDEDAQIIINRLNQTPANQISCTDNLQSLFNQGITISERYAGILAIPISRRPRDYLIFLRKEETQSIAWAGNPEKPVEYGPNGARLTPRKSFAAWQELRRGYCSPWLQKELGLGQLFRQMLLEIVIRNIDERERLVRDSQQQQDMLIHELNHRVRNILGLISSVVSKTASNSDDVIGFKEVLGGRIESIALAQNKLTQRNWTYAPLRSLIETELSAYASESSHKVQIKGPDIFLAPKAYTSLTLVIHELVTNAVKYGALKYDSGRLIINWFLNDKSELEFDWNESNYASQTEFKKGFGTVLINRSVPYDLGGKAEVNIHSMGAEVKLIIPETFISFGNKQAKESKSDLIRDNKSLPKTKAAQSTSALILEDNMIIALDLEESLNELNITTVHVTANSLEALSILNSKKVDVAILDVNLGGENSFDVGRACLKAGIPFVFVTGYHEINGIKENGFENINLMLKPFKQDELEEILSNILA